MPMGGDLRYLLSAIILGVVGGAARAQPGSSQVKVTVQPCAAAERLVRELVELELASGDLPTGAAVVDVHCVDQEILIAVDDRLTHKAVQRRLTITESNPASRARLIGTAVVELVRASWLELRVPPPPAVAPATPATTGARASANGNDDGWSWGAGGQLRFIGDFTSRGFALRAQRRAGMTWWSGDVTVERAVAGSTRGDIVAWAGSGALRVGLGGQRDGITIGLGGGLRLGAVSLVGHPSAGYASTIVGRRVTAPWISPIAVAEADAGGRIRLGVSGEIGTSLTGARGTLPLADERRWAGTFFAARLRLEVMW
jgi:hypothetical protein